MKALPEYLMVELDQLISREDAIDTVMRELCCTRKEAEIAVKQYEDELGRTATIH